jgi:tetratricopeptide (TPR) repeat protein
MANKMTRKPDPGPAEKRFAEMPETDGGAPNGSVTNDTSMRENPIGPTRRLLHPRWLAALLVVTFLGILIFQWWDAPHRQYEMGIAGLRAGDSARVQRAIAALEDVPAYQPHRDLLLASLHLADEEFDESLKLALRSQSHPDLEVQALVLAGEAAYRMGAAGNAKLFWEQALFQDPEYVPAHQWLGVLYFDLGAMDNALFHLETVSALSPDDPRPDRLMGLINLDYERPDVAIPHYRETLKRAPQQPDAQQIWLELAECQIKQREFDDAIESLSHCDPSADRKRLLAQCEMNTGSLDRARQLAAEALAEAPDELDSLLLSADLAAIDGDLQRAAKLLREGVRIDPYDHGTRTQLAQILGRLELPEEAAVHSARAEELQQQWQRFSDLQIDAINQRANAQIRLEIGLLAKQLGRPELANSWFKAALAIDPGLSAAADELSAAQ